MDTGQIHIAYCHITSIPKYQVNSLFFSFYLHIPKNKGDTGQFHTSKCNMTLIHICNVQHTTNLKIEVDTRQNHIAYCHITSIPIYQVYIYYNTLPKVKWKL